MWRVIGWTVVVVLCCGADVPASEAPSDTRLVEARVSLDEAASLAEANQYDAALARAEHALALREAALGGMHPDVATSLNVIGVLHWWHGQRTLAEPPLKRSLAIREAVLGRKHPDVAASLDALGNLYADLGFYDRAQPLYERALAIREKALGGTHPDVATSLHHLARLYQFQGRYHWAEPLYARALAVREAALGSTHPDVAASLNSIATIYQLQGRYSQAESFYERALAAYQSAPGNNAIYEAYSLGNLAYLYQDEGKYDRAGQFYQRSLTVFEAALGQEHPKAFDLLYALGQLHDSQGLYGESEALYDRAVGILAMALGKEDAEAASLLIHLGGRIEPLYERALAVSEETSLGRNRSRIVTSRQSGALLADPNTVSQMEPILTRALAVYEGALGKSNPDVATVLFRTAGFYQELGLHGRAVPLVQRALSIQEETMGPHHPQVAASLNHLASLYASQGMYAQAEPLQKRALSIWEASLGRNHPDVASSLTELGITYVHQRDHRRAAPLFERALTLRESTLGGTHPDVALSLIDLADLAQEQGSLKRAARLYLRALAIQEVSLGKSHPEVAITLNKLARIRIAQRRLPEAVHLFTRAFRISEEMFRHEALDLSESHMAGFLQFLRADEERIYALLRAHLNDPRVQRLALATVLLRKGRSVEETANTSRTIYRSLGEEDREGFDLLRSLRSQRARLSLDGPGRLAPGEYQERLKKLGEQGDALEAALATRSAPLRALAALPAPNEIVGRVAAALPRDGALVEFVAYTDGPLVPSPGEPETAQRPGHLRYLALVLFADGSSRAFDLGLATTLDSAAARFRDALASSDVDYRASSQELYSLAIKPLMPLPSSVHRLFVAPDGELNLTSFAALHDGQRFLIESFDVTYLTSGKELLPRSQDITPSRELVVLADPDFGTPKASPSRTTRSMPTSRAGLLDQSWPPLPGTRQEAMDIQQLVPHAQLFLGREATKDRLLQLTAPGVLHIATHGYFLEDSTPAPGSRAIGGIEPLGQNTGAQLPADPLLRSGLVLGRSQEVAAKPGDDTGSQPSESLVTALELAGLDLWGTELVVLAACDTGRGDIKLGQGVSGLRRALVVAGAETIVMSLWKVNDETTRMLMERYYRNLLAGQGRSAALRDAMRTLREARPHPHFWAPFISLGRDAPLRSLAPSTAQQQMP
ncbi:CHAT domain-containing tetratricopeptide repeat protein [Hyalangium versicolor]|uniref:CHAT domain-containing tetratricopeptide repeat protein n=1 Tax=Hyalangium versicolor TaxID=2861190 RepID=UPI001CCFC664|nr:tetratricopeptide repeat protein [Hyalangium versicolor]